MLAKGSGANGRRRSTSRSSDLIKKASEDAIHRGKKEYRLKPATVQYVQYTTLLEKKKSASCSWACEADWKVFCIRNDDPLAGAIHDVDDLERELGGVVAAVREWFRE